MKTLAFDGIGLGGCQHRSIHDWCLHGVSRPLGTSLGPRLCAQCSIFSCGYIFTLDPLVTPTYVGGDLFWPHDGVVETSRSRRINRRGIPGCLPARPHRNKTCHP